MPCAASWIGRKPDMSGRPWLSSGVVSSGPFPGGGEVDVRLVLFDLDGTLVDTAPDLTAAVNRTLTRFEREPVRETEVRAWVGDGARALVRRALTRSEPAEDDCVDAAFDLFWRFYGDALCVRSRSYPGARDALVSLRRGGMALGCVTNKPAAFARPLLRALHLAEYFDTVVAGDSLPVKKPSPEPLLLACEKLAVSPKQSVFVGDSANDVRAARAAGMRVICVSYGYNQRQDLIALGADALVDSLTDVAALFEH